jgi:hypothetical protein
VLTRESPTAQLSALATSRSVVAVSIRDTRLSGIIPVPLGRENWVDSLADRGTQPAHRYGRCPGRQTFFACVLTSPGELCPLIAPRMLRALWGKRSQKTEVAHFVEHATPKAILIWEDVYADTGGLRHIRRLT